MNKVNKVINKIIDEYKSLMKSYVAIAFLILEAVVIGFVSTFMTLLVSTILVAIVLGIKEYITSENQAVDNPEKSEE